MSDVLHDLTEGALRALAASLRDGALSIGINRSGVQQIAGPKAAEFEAYLDQLAQFGMTPPQMAVLVEAVAEERRHAPECSRLLDLVLSGPDIPGVPTANTAAVMHTLIEGAQKEVLLIGYAVHNGQVLFQRLAARMQDLPTLKVVFCLDVPRKYTDTSLADQIVKRFAQDFRSKDWPWKVLPAVYYDPRSLETATDRRSSLHAKCIVVDRTAALVTSANFTQAAQQRNIEVGVLIHHVPTIERLAAYFEKLISLGQLSRCVIE